MQILWIIPSLVVLSLACGGYKQNIEDNKNATLGDKIVIFLWIFAGVQGVIYAFTGRTLFGFLFGN